MKTFLESIFEKLKTSYWFLPLLLALMAMGAALGAVQVDEVLAKGELEEIFWIWNGGAESARQMLSMLAGSTITVIGVVFSITIVSLSLATSQFGSRLLRSFMNDKATQLVLGVFVGTYVYCLFVLRSIRTGEDGFIPHLGVTLALVLALVSIAFLVMFIHHISTLILAENVLARVADELLEVINRLMPEKCEPSEQRESKTWDELKFANKAIHKIFATENGFVQGISAQVLLKQAEEGDFFIRSLFRPGEFAMAGSPLLDVWSDKELSKEMTTALRNAFYFGKMRTPTQDIEYCVDQIVEVAVRALSPGINDPFTALTCVEWLGVGIVEYSKRKAPVEVHQDSKEKERLFIPTTDFTGLTDACFNQLRQYGVKSIAVTIHMFEVFGRIAPHLTHDYQKKALLKHVQSLFEDAQESILNKSDLECITQRFESARSALS